MKTIPGEVSSSDKWKLLGNTFAHTFSCFVAYLESMYGKKEVEKFFAFAADQAKFSFVSLKGKDLEEVAAMIFHLTQSFVDIKTKEFSKSMCTIETRCLMRSALTEMSLRSDIVCKFCEQVMARAIANSVDCEMRITTTSDGCKMVLSTT